MAKLVTDIGNQKLLVATPLQPVTIKSIAIGSGTGSFNSTITKLKTEVWRGDATAPIKNSDGELEISAIIPANVGGWIMTEWGWFDIEGDLIAYGQFDNTIYKAVGTMTIQPDLALALTGSVEADIIVTDSLNWEHNKMTGRNAADVHPISSITGLQTALDSQKIHSNLTGRNAADSHPTSAITGLDDFISRENQNRNSKIISDDYNVTATDGGSFIVDASSKNIKVVMAAASTASSIEYNFLRTDSSTNTVEIIPTGTDTFWGEGFNWPKAIMRKGEPFIFKKINGSTWSGVKGTRFQISATADDKPILVKEGVSLGELFYKSEAIGWGQTQLNVIGSRSLGQDYKNLTGRPIEVRVVAEGNSSSNPLIIRAGAAEIIRLNNSTVLSNTFTVQPGESYSVSGAVLHSWSELR